MSILLDKFRDYFFNSHIKINTAISVLAFVPFFAVTVSGASIYDKPVVNGVITHLKVTCEGKSFELDTMENNIPGALKSSQCPLDGLDNVIPSRGIILNGETLAISVQKASQVTIVDNGKISIKKTAYTKPSEILKNLNMPVAPEDIVNSDLVISNFQKEGIGQKITIQRAPTVLLESDGKTQTIHTWKKTVGQVLFDKGIAVGLEDQVVPNVDSLVQNGMKITVNRINQAETTEDEMLPFQTITQKDNGLYIGQTKVAAAGENGLKQRKFRVVYQNGVLIQKIILLETIIKEPKNRVISEGAKPYGREDLWSIMVEAGQKYGVDPGAMYRVMMCESGGNVGSVSWSGYRGLFQWDGSFYKWAAVAGVPADYFNPRSQIFATAARVRASGGWGAWSCKP